MFPDLLTLREEYERQGILLCFNGPTSRSLIEEIGHALRNYMQADQAAPGAIMDVFAIYIEMTQNIRHYAAQRGYSEKQSHATVAIGKDEEGRYAVSAANVVEQADGAELVRRIEAISLLDKVQLKAAYKEQLRRPRDEHSTSGAGLGLLDIARKASAPLTTALTELPAAQALFCLRAVI